MEGELVTLVIAAVSSLGAMGAAVATWRGVKLSRTPRLVCTPRLDDGWLTEVTITNAGLGAALRVYLCLVLEDELFVATGSERNVLPADGHFTKVPSFTKPVKLQRSDPSRLKGFFACFDVYGRPYVRTLEDTPVSGLSKWDGFRRVARDRDEYEVLGRIYGSEFASRARTMTRVGAKVE